MSATNSRINCLCLLLLYVGSASWLGLTEASTEYNRYLANIFRKYGNGGTMSFEGLEHLMYSLGLGQIEFDEHSIDDHRPNGAARGAADDAVAKSYFDQQSIQLLPSDEDDVQLKGDKEDGSKHRAEDIGGADVLLQERDVVLEFKEMHDPRHRHPRGHDGSSEGPALSANVCLSPKALLRLVVDHDDLHKRKLYRTFNTGQDQRHDFEEEYNDFINNVKLTPLAFMKLCPALLAQIDQHVCMQPAPLVRSDDEANALLWHAWIYATCSICILSGCGLLGILLVPLMKSAAYEEILKFLVAVAVGTLTGDALMHLLPHALVAENAESTAATAPIATPAAHAHDNTPVWICACAFATAVFMYILEHLLPLLRGNGGAHAHGHSHGGANRPRAPEKGAESATATPAVAPEAREINTMLDELKKDTKSPAAPLTPVAFMVIIGDGLHNLTDGLAIGAAFATDPVTGMATAFAVLCHELPHELGDFALLLQTGLPLRRAVCMNIVSSVLSFVGMAIGLLIAGMHSTMTQWIYAGTAGSFLYIAMADLIPAMNAEGEEGVKNVLIQITGIILGGVIMLLIAVNEETLEALFQ